MDILNTILLILLIGSLAMLSFSVVARQHSETRLSLRRLESKVDQLLGHAGLGTRLDLTQVNRALVAGEKIQAIKAYQEATGADLVTAKSAVERMQRGESPS